MNGSIAYPKSNPEHGKLLAALQKWNELRGGKTQNKEIFWFPKPNTSLTDMRDKLKVALEIQVSNLKSNKQAFFSENAVAVELAKRGAITRPGKDSASMIQEYEKETTANIPHISSFRMQNRLFRFLGWTARRPGHPNEYVVTRRGMQLCKFSGEFPGRIGPLSELDIVTRSLTNACVFSVNDGLSQWDTRFKQRIVVNLLRCCNVYGFITNNELVVSAFALKDERDPSQIDAMIDRLKRLHEGRVSMSDAFREVGIDPNNEAAVNNAYDSPKVLTSLCRQTGLLAEFTVSLKDEKQAALNELYKKMYEGEKMLKVPRALNIITDRGKRILEDEIDKRVIWFDELT